MKINDYLDAKKQLVPVHKDYVDLAHKAAVLQVEAWVEILEQALKVKAQDIVSLVRIQGKDMPEDADKLITAIAKSGFAVKEILVDKATGDILILR